jgi:hypothetical protein
MENEQYLIYRYFVIPTSQQRSLYDEEMSKEERFKKVIISLFEKRKIVFQYWNTRHILFYEKFESQRLFFLKYAKEIIRKKKVEGEKSIDEVEDSELKTVNIFIDLSTQFVLIQKKTTEFNKTDQVKNSVESFFSSKIKEYYYTVKVDEIPNKTEFWKFIEENSNIRSLCFKLNAPNFFFGNNDTKEALTIIKEEYNNDEITLSMKNHQNELIVSDNVSEFINYISTVGGEYSVEANTNGRKVFFRSKDSVRSILIPENWKDQDINILLLKIEQVQEGLKNESNN